MLHMKARWNLKKSVFFWRRFHQKKKTLISLCFCACRVVQTDIFFWGGGGVKSQTDQSQPRVKLYSPREESFPVPLRHNQNYSHEFGCQAREAHWWLLEYWWLKRLVWSLDGFHTIYSTRRKSSWRIYMVRGGVPRKQLTSRPDHLWPELWKSMGKNAKLKEKQKWAEDKDSSWQCKKIARNLFHRPWG